MSWGDGILIGLAVLAVVPVVVIALESLLALLPYRSKSSVFEGTRPRCAILVPAHNEEGGIESNIAGLRAQLQPGDRVIVIADNCSDATAERARQAGATAIERQDAERRGKGYALAFGIEHLVSDPPEIVVIIDADTRVHPQALEHLVRAAGSRNSPIQGVFTDAPQARGPREQWSAFALTFKNFVRPFGLYRLRLPCLLAGSGMAFPWGILRKAELGSGNIVEDMKLGIDLAVAGHPAGYCPEARFESDDAPSLAAAGQRRTRWEHGHVRTITSQGPRLLAAAFYRCSPRLFALALELAVPPLTLLFLGLFVLLLGAAGWLLLGGSELPLLILTTGASSGVFSILLAWMKFGRRLLSPKILCLLPIYVLWKIPIYLKLIIAPERKWIRTERNPTA